MIVVARSGRKQFGGRDGVPRMELFPHSSQMIHRGLFQIVLNCTRLKAEAPVCHKNTFYQPILLAFHPNFLACLHKNKTNKKISDRKIIFKRAKGENRDTNTEKQNKRSKRLKF